MGKKYIEILSRNSRRMINCDDIKKIYFRVPKKKPLLPLYSAAFEEKEPKSPAGTETSISLQDC